MSQTARPNYVNDARLGKPEAIAALINRSLNPQGISVSAAREGDVLHLVLLSEHALAQEKTVALIKRGLTSLGIESIRQVMLSARRVGDAQDLWHDEIELQPPADRILAQPNSTALQHPSITVPPDPEQQMGQAGGAIAQPGIPNAYAGAGLPPGAIAVPGTPSPQGGLSYPGQSNVPEQNLIGRQLAIANRLIRITPSGAEVINATPTQPYQPRRRPKPTASQFTPPANPIGRQMVTETLQKALLASNSVDLYGEVGVGKTSLLRSLAYHEPLVSDFEDGLFFRSIRRQPFSDMLQVLFDAFFDYEVSPPRMPTEAETRQAFESCQALVILDDSTLSGSETEQLSRQYPSLTWLYASEEPPTTSAAQNTVLKGLATTDGLSLLERGLGRPTNSQERIHAEGLCDRVQGHPLKILQMAALANEPDCSIGLLREELNTSAPEDLIFRHSTTLQEPERRILAVLTVLSKMPVHVRHLSSLTMLSNVSPMLENLVRRGLVLTDGLNYELAGNLVELLRNTWELDQWTQFALRYFTGWAQRQGMESLLQDAPLLSHVVELGIETNRWAEVRPLAYQLDQTLMLGKRWGSWQHLLQLCLQDSQHNGDQVTAGWAFHQLGSCALCQGDLTSAQHYLRQAIQVRTALNDQTGAALSQRNLDLVAVAPSGDVVEPEEEQEPVAPTATSTVSPVWLPLLQGLGIGVGLLAAAAFVGLTFNLIRDRLASSSQPSGQISPAPQVSPSIQLSTTALNFAAQGVNASSEAQTVTLQNLGNQPLPVAGVRLLGEQAGDFTVTDDCADAPIPPSGNCTATVLFTPLAEGDRRAQLVFSDAQGNSYATIPISGSGSATASASPSTPVILGLRPNQLAFNDQVVGVFSEPQTITLRNQGQFPLTIQNVRFTGQDQRDFRGDTDCVDTTLQPDASCTFTVYFRPGAERQSRASLVVTGLSNDSGAESRNWEVPLQGNGVAEGTTPSPSPTPSPTPSPSGSAGAAFSPSRISFGIQPVGSRSPIQVVTVSNTGTAPLQITGFSVTGGQQDDFSVSASSCGGDIAPDRQCTLSVQFSPQAAGDRTSNLSIRHTASDSPQLITLRGAGETPNAQRPRITRFDAIPQRVSAGQPFELCYGIVNANRASIEGFGDVQITPSNCLTFQTNRSRSYILTAVGRDNQQIQRDVFVTVVGSGGGGNQTPEFLQPGTPNEALATDLYTCQNVELSWNPVSTTSGAVDYLVKIERQDFVQPGVWLGWLPENLFERWTVVFEESVQVRPQVFVDSLLTNVGLYRWTVQTRSVNGAVSEPAPWHYFRCSGQR